MSKSRQSHKGANGPTSRSNDNLSAHAQGTWPQQRSSKSQRAAKAARVHTLTDPLGARGFRATGQRVRSETSARRKVLLASVATFAASFGIVVATNHTPANADPAATTNQPAATTSNSQASSNGSSVGSAIDLFSGQTTNGLTSTTSTSSSTTTTNKKHHDDGEGDDHENEDNSFLTTQPNGSNSSSQTVNSNNSQATSNQNGQSSFFVQQPVNQQPSHTRSGGS